MLSQMERSGELVVRSAAADSMVAGRRHQRLQQYYEGVPVAGGELTRQLDGDTTVSVFGTLHAGITLDPAPGISAAEAGRLASFATGGRLPASRAPELVVLPLDDGRYALAWRTETRSLTDVRSCFIDASSGRVLLDFSTLKPGQAAGAPAAPPTASSSPALAASRSAIDAVRRFYVQRTGRFDLDQAAEPVHVAAQPWADQASARSVIARGLAYAVLEHATTLIYWRESGALTDAYADIVAASVAAASGEGAAGGARDPWLVGDPELTGSLRSLRDPARFGLPDHYSRIDAGADSNAAASVAGHAFYLAIEGGANGTSGLDVEGVTAANREEVERAFVRAFEYLLPAAATLGTARDATVQSARDLYGPDSAAARAIGQAWAAAGVR
jgi:Zn-dependent metalloprotease